jgi:hypothetical protein
LTRRACRTTGVQSEPKSSRDNRRTWKRCQPRPAFATGQTSPQGGSGGAALGGPKKPRPAVTRRISPRRSGPKWQERMRNRYQRGKQMTTGASRLMHPGATLQEGSVFTATCLDCQIAPPMGEVRSPVKRWVSPHQVAGLRKARAV